MARRIRELMPQGFTSAEFIRLRYGTPAWAVFLAISIFYSMTWLISMAMAGGLLLEALAGIPYAAGMTVILAVCVIYTVFGGLYAVIGTDFIQSLIILTGVVVVGGAVLYESSITEIYTRMESNRPALLDVLFPAALMAVFNNLLFGLGEITHSNVWWSRAFAIRDGVGQKAYTLAGFVWFPIPIAAGFIALAAPSLGINVTRPDMVAPVVAGVLLGKAGAILVFIVVFSSLASSIDSLLAATSDLITKEIVERLLPGQGEKKLQAYATRVTVLLGVVTWAVCVAKVGTLATVLFFAGPMVGSTIWPIVAGLYHPRANASAATWAMVLGTGTGLLAYFLLGWYTASLVGTAVSMLVVWAGLTLERARFDWARLSALPTLASGE
jgi:Na+/proline symporter